MVNFWEQTSMTTRATLLALAMLASFVVAIIGAKTAYAATLKPVSVVSSDLLKVSDLFDGVTRNADYVIGAAPQPGQDMTLNARTLYRIASALDISWRPNSTNDQITVRREATVIPYSKIESTLRNELKNKGVSGRYDLTLNKGKPSIILPVDANEEVVLSSMDFDVQKDYFSATLVAPSLENPLKKIQVSGKIDRLISVPVLSQNLRNGDIIGQNDIQMVEISQGELQHGIIMQADDIIGMTPRRFAYAGKFIMDGSLIRPQLVDRGEPVSITFQEGPLVLTAKGKALQSGAKGDLVRVTNINSSRTIDAIVIGDNQVKVQ